jgi:hypothetical protein
MSFSFMVIIDNLPIEQIVTFTIQRTISRIT